MGGSGSGSDLSPHSSEIVVGGIRSGSSSSLSEGGSGRSLGYWPEKWMGENDRLRFLGLWVNERGNGVLEQ